MFTREKYPVSDFLINNDVQSQVSIIIQASRLSSHSCIHHQEGEFSAIDSTIDSFELNDDLGIVATIGMENVMLNHMEHDMIIRELAFRENNQSSSSKKV